MPLGATVLSQLRCTVGLPTPEATWKDLKLHKGTRGELQAVFSAARRSSCGLATAESLARAEEAERVARGGKHVSEGT